MQKKNSVSLEDLCVYALGTDQEAKTTTNDEWANNDADDESSEDKT